MNCAIIVAGGSGLRMKNTVRKQYIELGGVPILARTIKVFVKHRDVDRVFAVVPEEDFDFCASHIISHLKNGQGADYSVTLVAGGNKRQDSVFNGIAALSRDTSNVIIHDGVRPFIQAEKISDCINAAKVHQAAMLGLSVTDTLKEVDSHDTVIQTLERDRYWYAQTPQVFDYYLLKKAHEEVRKQGFYGTDDAALVERLGGTVKVIKGDRFNIKITTPEDLKFAELIYEKSDLF